MIEKTGSGFKLLYGDFSIPFVIETGPRQRLSITVFPDLRLRVLAPETAETAAVLERVDHRAKWITKQWRYFQGVAPPTPPRLYVSGETHLYLGRQYRLKVRNVENECEPESVKLIGRFFWIVTRDRSDTTHTKKLLERWYESHANAVFANRLTHCCQNARGLDLETLPPWGMRHMSKRWGTCTASGKILLNLDLVKTPTVCIDYVIFHELCHLKAPHHGKEFYQLLTRCLPDWEARKMRLEEFVF